MKPYDSKEAGPGVFVTTHWSVVLAAGHGRGAPDAAAALESLCRAYWYPLYAFLRRQGKPAEEAEDLTQDFFARFVEKHNPARQTGRGRGPLLLESVKRFLNTGPGAAAHLLFPCPGQGQRISMLRILRLRFPGRNRDGEREARDGSNQTNERI